MIRYGLIGAGNVGHKRAMALRPGQLIAVYDTDSLRAEALIAERGEGVAVGDLDTILQHPDIDALIIATRHDSLASLTLRAMKRGKHVLVEKPAARNAAELAPLLEAESTRGVCVRVGYNHRFHSSLQAARQIIDRGDLGPLFMIRGRYGHGGRLGYEKEWRAQREISGGGELIDQGVHLIDLARWFLGDFTKIRGTLETLYWPMQVEDNAFFELQTEKRATAWLHASCSEWKNLFSLELYGPHGKLQIEGLGGSYGIETLTHYRMKPVMGPPEVETREFSGADGSWRDELLAFENDIASGATSSCTLADSFATLQIVDEIYRQNPRSGI